jgi:hypothetical protein
MKYFISILFCSIVFAHNPNAELPDWKQYTRLGIVNSGMENPGVATYLRLKRTTSYTFQDIRIYGHFFDHDTEIRIRQKTSRRFMSLDWLYSFNTLIYEKNTLMDVNLRYHYNQGLGWLIRNSEESNTTLEIGVAFDNSDYLNTEQKTSYFRTGMTFDKDLKLFSTKLEVDYYHQLSEHVQNTDLSRFQMVGDVQLNFKKSILIVLGFTQDFQTNESFDFETASIFLTLAFKRPLNWTF